MPEGFEGAALPPRDFEASLGMIVFTGCGLGAVGSELGADIERSLQTPPRTAAATTAREVPAPSTAAGEWIGGSLGVALGVAAGVLFLRKIIDPWRAAKANAQSPLGTDLRENV